MKTNIVPVMISCHKREQIREQTLKRWRAIGGAPVRVVLDTEAIEEKGLTVERAQSRQELVALHALKCGLEPGAEYILFLEDDLEFNRFLLENVRAWRPVTEGVLHLGSLYNPNVVGDGEKSAWFVNTRCASPEKVYGSQAFLLSRACAEYCVANWWSVEGMQDIKMSRLAAQMPGTHWNTFYHYPSLVQHVGEESVWATDGRFHQAHDYDPEWRG